MAKEVIVPFEGSAGSKREQVEVMFDKVSGTYDHLNRIITFGMDKGWRLKVRDLVLRKKPARILDVATGTGDMAILFAESGAAAITGIDISTGMLQVAREKVAKLNLSDKIDFQVQDAEQLTFPDHSFDSVSVTYGIRNFQHLERGLAEIRRVLAVGGTFVILETSVPENFLIRMGYMFYTGKVMPLLGRMLSKDKDAYAYLSKSAINFPSGKKMEAVLEKVGFRNVKSMPQFFGASTIYYAEK